MLLPEDFSSEAFPEGKELYPKNWYKPSIPQSRNNRNLWLHKVKETTEESETPEGMKTSMFPASGAPKAWGPDTLPQKPVFSRIQPASIHWLFVYPCSRQTGKNKVTSVNTVSLSLLLEHSRCMLTLVLLFFFSSTQEWLFKRKELSMGLLKLLFDVGLTRKLSWLGRSLNLKQEGRLCGNDVIKEVTVAPAL